MFCFLFSVFEVKSSGHFDAFRKDCLSDVDINPAYQNLHTRVEDSVQKFLNRQVYTPDMSKIRLREEMRNNIIRAGFLESGVSRIVDQVVEQKMDYIQSKVEEILYNYIGIEKPIKEEKKNGSLKIDTELMPNDLEQVSDKTSLDSMDMKEEIEEEVVDDDFESPAFEPIEVSETKNENTEGSNLSEISGLTSKDSQDEKSGENEEPPPPGEEEIILEPKRETELSQISTTTQDNIPEVEPQPTIATALTLTGISGEEAQMAPSLNDSSEVDLKIAKDVEMNELQPQKSQFDLNKSTIEFTGTERKSINLDDSTNSGESDQKVLQPQDVQSNTMEIDNLYENDTTDSSEMKMEIDLKDESTQNTAASSKIEENSSQESLKEKKKEHKSEKSRESSHKSSHKSSRHHHSSSSSKSKQEKSSRSSHKSSSEKKSSSDKEKSSSSRKDREKERKSESKHKSSKNETDDHHQEKSSRRRRSTDHDSNDGRDEKPKDLKADKNSEAPKSEKPPETSKSEKPSNEPKSDSNEKPSDSPTSSKKVKEQKSSILVKYDYIKSSPTKLTPRTSESDDIKYEDAFRGFDNEAKSPHNPWYDVMDLMKSDQLPKAIKNNNYLNNKKDGTPARKLKIKKDAGECLRK